jgi:serine beta-lactamase-like protein LACTB, mitochondrial
MSRVNAPGLSLAVGEDGELRFEKGYGLADLENLVPATASTVYRLASVSKPITAVAAMQLVERRQLALDDTVGQWLPDMPAALRPITVRQLLSHQSGIRHYTREEDDSTQHYPRHYASLREALGTFANDPLVHAPGTRMTYSTYAYTLLGVVLEKASGKPYVETVTQQIFTPARMIHSAPDDVQAIVPRRAAGYARSATGALRKAAFMDPSYKIPGGGWLSTAGDMVRFGLAVQAGTLLKAASLERMTTMEAVAGRPDTFYGLGWIVGGWGVPGAPRIPGLAWHGGVQQGVTTNLYVLLPERIVVAVMINLEGEGSPRPNWRRRSAPSWSAAARPSRLTSARATGAAGDERQSSSRASGPRSATHRPPGPPPPHNRRGQRRRARKTWREAGWARC